MFQEWAAVLSVHQLITISELSLFLWCRVELIVNWSNQFLRTVVLSLVHLPSSVNERLDFSVLALNNLGHCLVEEVLSCISPTSALRSRPVLVFELPLAHWNLVWLSPWNLEATINDWVNLMINDEIMAVLSHFRFSCWHC